MSGSNAYPLRSSYRDGILLACTLLANPSGGANNPSIETGKGFSTPLYGGATGKYTLVVGPPAASRLPLQGGGKFRLLGSPNARAASSSAAVASVQAITVSGGVTTLTIEWRLAGVLTNMSANDRIDLSGILAGGADADVVTAV